MFNRGDKSFEIVSLFPAKCSRECCTIVEIDLADKKESLFQEGVWWDLQVEGGWALADATAGVVMWSVARAVVAAVVSRIGDRHAAQVSADANDDEPLRVLHAVVVVLCIAKAWHGNGLLNGDLLSCAVTDEERLAAPLEGHWLSFWDVSQFDFDLSQSQDVSRCAHRLDEGMNESFRWVSWGDGGSWNRRNVKRELDWCKRQTSNKHIGEGLSVLCWFSPACSTLRWIAAVLGEVWRFDVSVSKSHLSGR